MNPDHSPPSKLQRSITETVSLAIRRALAYEQGHVIIDVGSISIDDLLKERWNEGYDVLYAKDILSVIRDNGGDPKVSEESRGIILVGYSDSFFTNRKEEQDLQRIVRGIENLSPREFYNVIVLTNKLPGTHIFNHDMWWNNGPFHHVVYQCLRHDESLLLKKYQTEEIRYEEPEQWKEIDCFQYRM